MNNGNTHFEIDEYPLITPYLEIEGTPKNIQRYVNKLGFIMEQTTPLTAPQVLKKYKVNQHFLKF